jgi:hypothetical protein
MILTTVTADTLFWVISALSLGFIFLGAYTRARIYNIFAVGTFIYLATQVEHVALVVVFLFLIIYQLYYVFLEGNR